MHRQFLALFPGVARYRGVTNIHHLFDHVQLTKPVRSLGITAGASAPDALVEELIAHLREMTETEVEVLPGVTENVRFRMPPQLVDSPSRG